MLISCRIPVLEKASKSVWELILDNNGLGKEISETVERVFCRLSGQEPPLFPDLNIESQPEKETEEVRWKGNEKEIENVDENKKENENEKEEDNMVSKKRSFTEMNSEGEENDIASRCSDPQAIPEDS